MNNKVIQIEDVISDVDSGTGNADGNTDIKDDTPSTGAENPDTGENKSESSIEDKINELPENFPAAQPAIQNEIAPLILKQSEGMQDFFIDLIKKQTKASKQSVKLEIQEAKKKLDSADSEIINVDDDDPEETDPVVIAMADEIAHDPLLFKRRIDTVNQLGIINERKVIGMYVLTIDSRLNPNDVKGANILATKNAGIQGSGKSATLNATLELYPKSAYHYISGGSSKSLFYLENGLKHKALIIGEAFSFQSNNSNDTEFSYIARSLLSEGYVVYQYTSWVDGKKITISVKVSGPTSLITTTIYGALEPQIDSRMFSVSPDVSSDQTKNVLYIEARQAAGELEEVDDKEIRAFKVFHGSLEPLEVIIPYAKDIYRLLEQNGDLPIPARRAFKRVIVSIKTIGLAYQKQRDKDDSGRVIAEYQDYYLTHQLINNSFKESLGDEKYTDDRIGLVEKHSPITPRKLAKLEGVSGPAITDWSKKWLERGIICWSDKNGNRIKDTKTLKKAKSTGKAYLKVVRMNRLPTIFELTGDPRWDVGGELYEKYDLQLDPVEPVLSDDCDENEDIQDTEESESGIKALNDIQHEQEKIKIPESSWKPQEAVVDNISAEELFKEFSESWFSTEKIKAANNTAVEKPAELSNGVMTV